MKLLRRFPFTLIEMMVVMTILALSLTAVGIQVGRFLKEQRFLSDVGHVIRELQAAQDLMLVLDLDVKVRIAYDPEQKGIDYKLVLEKKAKEEWLKLIERPNRPLQYITSIVYQRAHLPDENSDLGITLKFPVGGVTMAKGVLILKGETSDLERKIDLRGYPIPSPTNMTIRHHPNLMRRDGKMTPSGLP